MDADTKTQIILAATASAGPVSDPDWTLHVTEAATRITAMLSDTSDVSQAIAQIEAAKVFPAVVESVKREESSTRALVTLKTRPSEHHPDGLEQARTARTDTRLGLAMAKRLTALRGHRVMLWVEVEPIGNGTRKVRVIRHVEDLGAETPAAAAS